MSIWRSIDLKSHLSHWDWKNHHTRSSLKFRLKKRSWAECLLACISDFYFHLISRVYNINHKRRVGHSEDWEPGMGGKIGKFVDGRLWWCQSGAPISVRTAVRGCCEQEHTLRRPQALTAPQQKSYVSLVWGNKQILCYVVCVQLDLNVASL